ncbi:MAG TPA: metallophosphoesterase [Ktedonobacterales bacterium]|jgi:predicted phosphodiesterase|nr:metallophosphoesterase [Ktedonobacterales bacterium]
MRIALLADIHGNLAALDTTLADLAERHVDEIICLGDLAMSGPQPHECVAEIAARRLESPIACGRRYGRA